MISRLATTWTVPRRLDDDEGKLQQNETRLTSSNLIHILNRLKRQRRARFRNKPRSLGIHPHVQVAPRSVLGRQVSKSSTGSLAVLDRKLLPTDSERVARVDVLVVRQTNIAGSLKSGRNDPWVVQIEGNTDVACRSVYTRRVSAVGWSRGSLKCFALDISKLGCQTSPRHSG